MMKAREYASFILQTGLEFGMTVYYINNLFCWTKEDAEKTSFTGIQIPQEDWVEIQTCEVRRINIFPIIEGWNICYFPSAVTAEQARQEFLEIIKIEDEDTRITEFNNWYAERSSWKEII